MIHALPRALQEKIFSEYLNPASTLAVATTNRQFQNLIENEDFQKHLAFTQFPGSKGTFLSSSSTFYRRFLATRSPTPIFAWYASIIFTKNLPCYLRFTPDTHQIIITTEKGNVALYDIQLNTRIWSFEGSTLKPLVQIIQNKVLVQSAQKAISLLNLHTGAVLKTFKHPLEKHDYIRQLQAHDTYFYTATLQGVLTKWDLETGKLLSSSQIPSGTIQEITLQGEAILLSDRTISLWNPETQTNTPFTDTEPSQPEYLKLSLDQKKIYSTSGRDLKIWDLKEGRCITTFKTIVTDKIIEHLQITLDNQRAILGCNEGTLLLFDLEKGRLLHSHKTTHRDLIADLQMTPAGDRVASASLGKDVQFFSFTALPEERINALIHAFFAGKLTEEEVKKYKLPLFVKEAISPNNLVAYNATNVALPCIYNTLKRATRAAPSAQTKLLTEAIQRTLSLAPILQRAIYENLRKNGAHLTYCSLKGSSIENRIRAIAQTMDDFARLSI